MATEPLIPFSAATSSTWEAQAIEKVHEMTDPRAYKLLNGRRVTVWRICVEKKRRELAAIFGMSPGALTELPPDCRGKILEFLPAAPSGGAVHGAEVQRLLDKRIAVVVDTWAGVLLSQVRDNAAQKGWPGSIFRKSAISEDSAPGTLSVAEQVDGKWWQFPPLRKKIEGLGYHFGVRTEEKMKEARDAGERDPHVVDIKPRRIGR